MMCHHVVINPLPNSTLLWPPTIAAEVALDSALTKTPLLPLTSGEDIRSGRRFIGANAHPADHPGSTNKFDHSRLAH